jgi:hypothetical protein
MYLGRPSLMSIKISFIIGALSDNDILALEEGYTVISKMILSPNDYNLFHYSVGQNIEVESMDGKRLLCEIVDLEVITDDMQTILIFSLLKQH